MPATARKEDVNGWYEIKSNPLSKVGVFPYLGKSIDADGQLGLDPNKIYNVYRSEQELSDPETIESFKLLPWIDEHTMLGKSDIGLTPAEQKGVEGVTGQEVYFEDGYIRGNIKLFSEDLAQKVNEGKNELSCGYRCKYELKSGVFGDQEYQVEQKAIRGNHLASVPQGRMGPDVAVLDEKNEFIFTIDAKELILMPDPKKEVLTGDAAIAALTTTVEGLVKMVGDQSEKMEEMEKKADAKDKYDEEEMAKKKAAEDAEEEKKKAKDMEHGNDDDTDKDKEKNKVAMDSMEATIKTQGEQIDTMKKDGFKSLVAEMSSRDSLYNIVSQHTGVFDHAEMTTQDVAVYACDKLELKDVPEGQEITAVNCFLKDRSKSTAFTLDSAHTSANSEGVAKVNGYFSGQKGS